MHQVALHHRCTRVPGYFHSGTQRVQTRLTSDFSSCPLKPLDHAQGRSNALSDSIALLPLYNSSFEHILLPSCLIQHLQRPLLLSLHQRVRMSSS